MDPGDVRPRLFTAVPAGPATGQVYVNRTARRTFDEDCNFLKAPAHRAAVGGYLSDLLRPYAMAVREDQLAAGNGQSYGEMAARLIADVADEDEPVDLLVLAFAVPDVQPGRATATYLSEVCPGNPLSFAICDQGAAAAYTGLRLVSEYVATGGCQRALLILVEQTTPLYDVAGPAPVPARSAGVALLCGFRPDATATGRLGAVEIRGDVSTETAVEHVAASRAAGLTTIVGSGLSDVDPAAVAAPTGQPFTGVWWRWAEPAGPAPVRLIDYDPHQRYLCSVTFEAV